MIAIRLQGRLGNQLFQYAFALTASKKLNTRFFIDQYIEHSIVDKYFKVRQTKYSEFISQLFRIKGFKNFFSFYLRRAYFKNLILLKKFSVVEYNYEASVPEVTLQNNTLYQGYFQSELFFNGTAGVIRDKFVLKDLYIGQFNSRYGNLYKNNRIVTVHIRRTDYLNLQHLNLGGDDLSLPILYYKKAIAEYNEQDVHFVFISDDIDFVNRNFEEIKNKTISTDSEILDFQHLLNADGCIISNSTFSWWGAWLNNKTEKVIYAPKYFMGWRIKKETPINIYPKEWVQIDF